MIKLLSMTMLLVLILTFVVPGIATASIAPAEVVSACEQEAVSNGATKTDMADYVNPCLEEKGFSPLAKVEPMDQDVTEAQEIVEESSENQ